MSYSSGNKRLIEALLGRGWEQVIRRVLAEEQFRAEIRDYVRHRWREETGQIPRGSGMASSWGGSVSHRATSDR